jgi:hypothetical protein
MHKGKTIDAASPRLPGSSVQGAVPLSLNKWKIAVAKTKETRFFSATGRFPSQKLQWSRIIGFRVKIISGTDHQASDWFLMV